MKKKLLKAKQLSKKEQELIKGGRSRICIADCAENEICDYDRCYKQ